MVLQKKGLAYISYLSNNKWRVGENFASNLNTSFFVGDTLFLGHTNGDVGYIVRGKQEAEKIVHEYSSKKQQFIESSVIAFISWSLCSWAISSMRASFEDFRLARIPRASFNRRRVSRFSAVRFFSCSSSPLNWTRLALNPRI